MTVKKALLFLLISLASLTAFTQNFPERPNRLVNDYTSTLSAEQVTALEQKLVAFYDTTSTQIAVVIINSLEGYDVADYAVRLAETWGIGRQGKNNGVLVLASLGDRKITIQTGYGVEGALPDAISKRIITNEITPSFRQGDYYQGLDRGTDAIISYTKGEYKNDAPRNKKRKGGSAGFIIIIVLLIIIFISRRGGGGGTVISGRGAASPFWWMLMGSGMGRSRSGWGGFSGGGGGFGSSGGGGFGGFGGGSFGGGGASGSW